MSSLCAHRGLSHACPENTLPAFGAAIALGVAEIEFDLWLSRDGVPVVCHDKTVDRTTDGEGAIGDLDWPKIQKLDAGKYAGELWRDGRVPKLEEVLDFAGQSVGLNIHIKDPGSEGALVRMVCQEIMSRDLMRLAYIAGDASVLSVAREVAPDVKRCCLAGQNTPDHQVDLAVEYGCERLQFKRDVSDEAIKRAKDHDLIRNLFWSDEPEDAKEYIRRGIDVVLTNRANLLLSVV